MKNKLGGKITKEFFGLRAKRLKLNFSKFYLKLAHFSSFSYLHMNLPLQNLIASFLVPFFEKIVKQYDHNEINHQSEKCSEIKNQYRRFSSNVNLPMYPSINTKKILFLQR